MLGVLIIKTFFNLDLVVTISYIKVFFNQRSSILQLAYKDKFCHMAPLRLTVVSDEEKG